jgi:hypothetical protein
MILGWPNKRQMTVAGKPNERLLPTEESLGRGIEGDS